MSLNNFLICLIILFCNTAFANEKIAYVDLDYIYKNSLAGKSILMTMNKYKKEKLTKFQDEEKLIQKRETQLIYQKNILNKEEYQKKVLSLKKEILEYRESRIKSNKSFQEKQYKAKMLLLDSLTPILTDYAENNSISILIDKKNIILGKSSLDTTPEIILLLNKKIKKIKIN